MVVFTFDFKQHGASSPHVKHVHVHVHVLHNGSSHLAHRSALGVAMTSASVGQVTVVCGACHVADAAVSVRPMRAQPAAASNASVAPPTVHAHEVPTLLSFSSVDTFEAGTRPSTFSAMSARSVIRPCSPRPKHTATDCPNHCKLHCLAQDVIWGSMEGGSASVHGGQTRCQ